MDIWIGGIAMAVGVGIICFIAWLATRKDSIYRGTSSRGWEQKPKSDEVLKPKKPS